MFIITGGAGFIGSALAWKLNQLGVEEIILVDSLGESDKWKNLRALKYLDYIEKDDFLWRLFDNFIQADNITGIIHLGACSSTTEKNASYLASNNFDYSKQLALYCVENEIPFIYASSAATYGGGEKGYKDDEENVDSLRPLNMYGHSKQMFDQWAIRNGIMDRITGIKFFNVYGPNEYHKGNMASMVYKAYYQIKKDGKARLFKSGDPDYKDGEQKRDFVYIKDVVNVILQFMNNPQLTGLYNLGSGQANTWNTLIGSIFKAMKIKKNIEYVDMQEELKGKYQYFTQADMEKVKSTGVELEITPIEKAVKDYVINYLEKDNFLGDE
ncbi:MAG: ADP-glyceromanno-heptose 6-epimerase [Candidatus Muiribacterium halophilum]|uniref:ADP-L-glycero-D-manno-heptose-6-epimerase n=1 Tax=Muiribacterium halophilum TaxID=2053465 RepID=A0A2N5ZC73_MUIH1|nr:MAG: ADP-glyceromanno-heptose 6-epimerase [Candidatus Muirbacterium halophilum]